MKFNEFVALDMQLKQDGTSINEIVKEVTGEYLFEEEVLEAKDKEDSTKLDTGGDVAKRITSPRFAKARKKLANNARKFINVASKNIIDKYLPKQLEQLKDMANKMAGMRADKKNPKEIINVLGGEIKKIQTIHDKSTLQLEQAIDKMEESFNKRVDVIIKNDKLSEKSQLKLDMFWTLLTVQVKQKLFQKIIKARAGSIEEIANNNPELGKMLETMAKLPHTEAEIAKMGKEADEQKKKYAGGGEKDKDKDIVAEDGESYQWTNAKGSVMKIKIVGKNPDKEGEFEVEITSPKGKVTKGSVTQKTINKNLGKKIK